MAAKPINVDSALRAAFLKTELAHLKGHPHFMAAMDKTKTAADFAELCELAEQLLKVEDQAHPVGKQFRSTLNRDDKGGPPATQ